MAIILSLVAFCSTYIWWLFSIRFKDKLHYIMSFTAWVLLGVISFELLPEIIELLNEYKFNPNYAMIALVSWFLLFHILEKTILIHHAHEWDYSAHKHPKVWVLSALALAWHSFMDWVWIGLGFHISPSVWFVVALAIISHDFTDGMNTITFMLTHNNTLKKAKMFLLLDAVAPMAWVLSTMFFSPSPLFLVLYLWFFTGFLLYIWASDILPEAHREKSSYRQILLTILWVAFIYMIVQFS